MLQKINNDNTRIFLKILSVVFICIFTVLFIFAITAYIIVHVDFSYDTLPFITASILSISAVIDGFVISKLSKENGLFWGVFAGLIIVISIIIISLFLKTFSLNTNLLTKSTVAIISGAIGGIIGVNVN